MSWLFTQSFILCALAFVAGAVLTWLPLRATIRKLRAENAHAHQAAQPALSAAEPTALVITDLDQARATDEALETDLAKVGSEAIEPEAVGVGVGVEGAKTGGVATGGGTAEGATATDQETLRPTAINLGTTWTVSNPATEDSKPFVISVQNEKKVEASSEVVEASGAVIEASGVVVDDPATIEFPRQVEPSKEAEEPQGVGAPAGAEVPAEEQPLTKAEGLEAPQWLKDRLEGRGEERGEEEAGEASEVATSRPQTEPVNGDEAAGQPVNGDETVGREERPGVAVSAGDSHRSDSEPSPKVAKAAVLTAAATTAAATVVEATTATATATVVEATTAKAAPKAATVKTAKAATAKAAKAKGQKVAPPALVKCNSRSMVFHTPASPYFNRMKGDVTFTTPEEAERAGYTRWSPKPKTAPDPTPKAGANR
ncbi:hypothetical protein [Saccharothrix lopnurensis]|uniref:Uncharacterized protein n=1 Tax=Saccharothrix lopnurensis TaxID=1670621 RepID=A0ABW1P4I7_9PSEU